jgi:hypothetical protein
MTRLSIWIHRAAIVARHRAKRIAIAAAFALMAGVGNSSQIAPAFGPQAASAQTETPIPPTSTPIALSIDTNSLLTQVNTWTGSLDDVVFLGVAISIAIALLTFIGAQILKAFKGGSLD